MKIVISENIRPARPEDFEQVAPLIIQAMEDLACTFANTADPQMAIPLFEYFFQIEEEQNLAKTYLKELELKTHQNRF